MHQLEQRETRTTFAELGTFCRAMSWTGPDSTVYCVATTAVLDGDRTARDGAHALIARQMGADHGR